MRDSANAVACASNMRQMGMLIRQFASMNNDRAPAAANTGSGSVRWSNVINMVLLNKPPTGMTGSYIQVTGLPQQGTLSCPAYTASVNQGRAFLYTVSLHGGDATDLVPGPYGYMVDTPTQVHDSFIRYKLGTKISKFRDPSMKFMVLESETNSDLTNNTFGGDLVWALGDTPGRPAFAGNAGRFAFRHSRYTRANALFIDGHVEQLVPPARLGQPRMEINTARRFNIAPW